MEWCAGRQAKDKEIKNWESYQLHHNDFGSLSVKKKQKKEEKKYDTCVFLESNV